MRVYEFELAGHWRGGLGGRGQLVTAEGVLPVAAPRGLGGAGNAHDPEELLLAAAATCFLITLAAVLERQNLAYTALSIKSHGIVEWGAQGPTLKSIVH